MSIKMPLKFLGSYKVVIRQGETEKQEICQKLTMTPIAEQEKNATDGESSPTHLITYFCFGCRRILEGRLIENREDGAVFQVDERKFEFCPSIRMC
ncbi:MAG: hypothetical protein LLG06_08650 [Desulfobacteraceae bacterium]|nr:hypothetical protein [Desulfobacteraceae bacterium]